MSNLYIIPKYSIFLGGFNEFQGHKVNEGHFFGFL